MGSGVGLMVTIQNTPSLLNGPTSHLKTTRFPCEPFQEEQPLEGMREPERSQEIIQRYRRALEEVSVRSVINRLPDECANTLPALPQESRAALLRCVKNLPRIADEAEQAFVLAQLAASLSTPKAQREALALVQKRLPCLTAEDRSYAVSWLLPIFSQEEKTCAADAWSQAIPADERLANQEALYLRFFPFLSEEAKEKLVGWFCENLVDRYLPYHLFVPHLSQAERARIWDKIAKESTRLFSGACLLKLLPCLPKEEQALHLGEVLSLLTKIFVERGYSYFEDFFWVVFSLPLEAVSPALSGASSPLPRALWEALLAIERAPHGALPEALHTIRELVEQTKIDTLPIALLSRLPHEERRSAWPFIRDIFREQLPLGQSRIKRLVSLLAPLGFGSSLVRLIRESPGEFQNRYRFASLAAYAPYTSGMERKKILTEALSLLSVDIEDDLGLSRLADFAEELSPEDLYPLWCQALSHLATIERGRFFGMNRFEERAFLLPYLGVLGGEEAILGVARSLDEVFRCFP